MIFTLEMGPLPLVGIVGKDGQLFWGAVSVGRLVKHKYPYYFSRTRSSTYTKEVVFDHLLDRYFLRDLQNKVLTHRWVLGLLEKCPNEQAQLVHDHLNRGNFYVEVTMSGRGPLYPNARLCPPDTPNAKSFFTWIDDWKRGTFKAAAAAAAKKTTTATATAADTTTTTTTEPATVLTIPRIEPVIVTIPRTKPAATNKMLVPYVKLTPLPTPYVQLTEVPATPPPPADIKPRIPDAIEVTKVPTTAAATPPPADIKPADIKPRISDFIEMAPASVSALGTTTDADDEMDQEEVKPPPTPTAAATSPQSPSPPLPERGANSIGKWRAIGSPGYSPQAPPPPPQPESGQPHYSPQSPPPPQPESGQFIYPHGKRQGRMIYNAHGSPEYRVSPPPPARRSPHYNPQSPQPELFTFPQDRCRGPHDRYRLRITYNARGSPDYSLSPRSSTPYSPSHPPYTPTPPPANAPPPPQPEEEQDQPPNLQPEQNQPPNLQPEQDQPLDLTSNRIQGVTFWFDSIPGNKIYVFHGDKSYAYIREKK